MVMKQVAILREFIEREMTARDMSTHEFADFVGVSQSTIVRAMSYEDAPEPKLNFLAKLAVATKVDIGVLVSLIKPEASKISPDARLLAELERDQHLTARQRADRRAAYDEIVRLSVDVFWEQEDRFINQILLRLMGDVRLAVLDGEIEELVNNPPPPHLRRVE